MKVAFTLSGAQHRLLHASVPATFFGLAIISQGVFWALVGLSATEISGSAGGPGIPLAAVHVLTLGTFLATAFGATQQILPVTTLQNAPSPGQGWALLIPLLGAAVLLPAGFASFHTPTLYGGAALAAGAVGLYTVRLVTLIRGAKEGTLVGVRHYLWGAVAMAVAMTLVAILLVGDYSRALLPDHTAGALVHMTLAAYGLMGLLVLGLSNILVPMLVISQPPDRDDAYRALPSALIGLGLSVTGLLSGNQPLVLIGIGFGLVAALFHSLLMRRILKARMRRRMDHGLPLMIASWVLLPLSLLAAGLAAMGLRVEITAPLFIALLLPGWLLSIMTGILQRILPFLASMHTMRAGRAPALVTHLTWALPLRVHAALHLSAVALLATGLLLGQSGVIAGSAFAGVAGAIAFATHGLTVLVRTRRHMARSDACPASSTKPSGSSS